MVRSARYILQIAQVNPVSSETVKGSQPMKKVTLREKVSDTECRHLAYHAVVGSHCHGSPCRSKVACTTASAPCIGTKEAIAMHQVQRGTVSHLGRMR